MEGKYSYVIGMSTPLGWVYKIQGDNMSAFTKKDCACRIRNLFKYGVINKECRDYLLNDLRGLKRGT